MDRDANYVGECKELPFVALLNAFTICYKEMIKVVPAEERGKVDWTFIPQKGPDNSDPLPQAGFVVWVIREHEASIQFTFSEWLDRLAKEYGD